MGETTRSYTLDPTWCATCPLREVSSVDRFSAAEFAALKGGSCQPRTALAGTQLIHEDDPESRVFFLATGWVERSHRLSDGRQLNIQFHLPGDIIGYGAALLGQPPHYSIEALTAISYLALERERVATAFRTKPDFARKLAIRMVRRLHGDDFRLMNLARRKVEERLAAFLLSLFVQLRQLQLVADDCFDLPLSQQHIADTIGTHPVHVNRMLRRLREAGIVTVQQRTVHIHDLDRLRRSGCYCANTCGDLFARNATPIG
jgi:CRP/FNR family transcriptional regulator